MRKEEYLKTVEKQIQFIFDRNTICKELEEHLIDSIEDLMEEGLSKEEAEKVAVKQMGDPIKVGKQLNKEHHPWIGYLLIVSRCVLLFLIINFVILGISDLSSVWMLVTPIVVEDSAEVYPIDYRIDGIAQDVIVDNICIDEKGQYKLTFRAIRDFSYSRSPSWNCNISIKEIYINEEFWVNPGGGSYRTFGSYGYIEFDYPENHILSIWIKEDDIYVDLDLRDYL